VQLASDPRKCPDLPLIGGGAALAVAKPMWRFGPALVFALAAAAVRADPGSFVVFDVEYEADGSTQRDEAIVLEFGGERIGGRDPRTGRRVFVAAPPFDRLVLDGTTASFVASAPRRGDPPANVVFEDAWLDHAPRFAGAACDAPRLILRRTVRAPRPPTAEALEAARSECADVDDCLPGQLATLRGYRACPRWVPPAKFEGDAFSSVAHLLAPAWDAGDPKVLRAFCSDGYDAACSDLATLYASELKRTGAACSVRAQRGANSVGWSGYVTLADRCPAAAGATVDTLACLLRGECRIEYRVYAGPWVPLVRDALPEPLVARRLKHR
jgi:hypothetical protein